MRVIAFLVLLTLTTAGATPTERVGPHHWIFSWVLRSGIYHYVVVRESERAAFVNGFRPSFPGHGDISHLKAELLTLPTGAKVGWGDAPCVGLTFPPKETMRSVRLFAGGRGISLVVLPGQCDNIKN